MSESLFHFHCIPGVQGHFHAIHHILLALFASRHLPYKLVYFIVSY